MSNNIYDILKKMQNLEAPKQSLTESKKAKPDYIDIDKDGDTEEPMKKAAKEKSKGAVAEAVATVERQLSEKYMGFKKTVAAIKKGGSAENPEAVAAEIGRNKYGKKKFQKAAAAGKKLGEEAPPLTVDNSGDYPVYKQIPYNQRTLSQKFFDPTEPKGSNRTRDNKAEWRHEVQGHAYTDSSGMGYDRFGNPRYPEGSMGKKADAEWDQFKSNAKKTFGLDEGEYNEEMLSPKEKSFAALAEPKDKITYADKIAGAKKKSMAEGWEEMQKYLEKKKGPESKGGAGKKAGTRYGGSAQADDAEEHDGEGKPVEKKKGRPKGTGGGAKFNFNKSKK